MAITIKDITELPTGTPTASEPLIFGRGTNLFTVTRDILLGLVDQGITDLTINKLDTALLYIEGSGVNILDSIDITIVAGELKFISLVYIDTNNAVSINTYLVPLGAGTYNPLSSEITFDDLILIEKKPTALDFSSETNTTTYVAADLAAVNASSPALDLSNSNIVYFLDLDDGFYRFIGTNGLYGSGELQMVQGDLVSVSQVVDFPQPATGTPPVSGTFSIDLSNYFGTDYTGTSTSLETIDIASGAVLGGFARVKGNWANKPTFTGATEAGVSNFTASTDLYLYVERWDDGVIYWYDVD